MPVGAAHKSPRARQSRVAPTPSGQRPLHEVWIRELDPVAGRLVGDEHVVWHGALENAVWAEGPHLYRVDEVRAIWRRIQAAVLLVQSDHIDAFHQFVLQPEYDERLGAIAGLTRATVREAGHMLHHDQPEAVARLVERFLA